MSEESRNFFKEGTVMIGKDKASDLLRNKECPIFLIGIKHTVKRNIIKKGSNIISRADFLKS